MKVFYKEFFQSHKIGYGHTHLQTNIYFTYF